MVVTQVRTVDHHRNTCGTPEFRPIAERDWARLQRYTSMFPPYSDHHPFGLLCWNTSNDGAYAVVNGNLALKLRSYSGQGHSLTFVGTRHVAKTVRQLLHYADQHPDVDPVLQCIPEFVIRHTRDIRERFIVERSPDDDDYVFGISEMASLQGTDLSEKRAAIRRLQRETSAELRQIDLSEPSAQALVLDIFDQWALAKGNADLSETQNERAALCRMFHLLPLAGNQLVALALFDRVGTPLGFCTAEMVGRGFAMGHFEKAVPSHPGASALMRQRLAAYLQVRGYRYFNAEQDLGEPGLRTSKLSWSPRFLLRKYTIAPR